MTAWALGRIGDPRAVAPLRALAESENRLVQQWARHALSDLNVDDGAAQDGDR